MFVFQGRFMQRAGPGALKGGQDASRRQLLKKQSQARALKAEFDTKQQSTPSPAGAESFACACSHIVATAMG